MMTETATGKLRALQLVESEMLSDFKKLCEENNLRYFLDFGTLLGAVRHQGFIPWDDDIDVTMPYEDYIRFLDIAQKEFGDKYFLQTSDTDVNYYRTYARIRKNGTTFMDSYHLGWKIHHGVWLDIFPIIEINDGLEFKYKKLIMQLSNYILMDNFFDVHIDEFEKKIGKVSVKLIKSIHKIPRNKRVKIKNRLQRCIFTAKNKKYRACVWMGISAIYPHDIYDSSSSILFEGEYYSVPSQYEKKLELSYGDYMQLPPENERKGHGGDVIIDLENNYTLYTDK